MTFNGLLQIAIYFIVLIILAKPLGLYIARVFTNKPCWLDLVFKPIERLIYRACGINPEQEMHWKGYIFAILFFNFVGLITLYLIQRCQHLLPLNPQLFKAVSPDSAFNTAVSFVTNTNWQSYIGENTLSYFTQLLGLTVQNFVSAATGIAVLMALIRGFSRYETVNLGNFWVDLTRGTLYILLPLSTILAIILVSQGVIQNYKPYTKAQLLQPIVYTQSKENQEIKVTKPIMVNEQVIPMGPVASQIAIKQLGSNGGGFFGTNSAHPFENPTPFSNFLEMLALLLIPASLCFTFGAMVNDKKQGRALFIVMTLIFLSFLFIAIKAEQTPNPLLTTLNIDQNYHYAMPFSSGGNMEGKETRFGIVNSALWATATASSSNGAINSVLDSFMPLGGLVPMLLIQLGEVVFGGVGSGMCSMLVFVILTVFIAGLMVGRTPEYLGKKIEVFEMKMASLVVLIPSLLILVFTAIAVSNNYGASAIANHGAHGFSEILYAFSSTANNNGSDFAGLNDNNFFYNTLTGLAMLFGRFWIIVPVLAIAGSLARKKTIPSSKGTMPTHTPLFIGLITSVILLIGALAFLPALALGPIIEHLTMFLGH